MLSPHVHHHQLESSTGALFLWKRPSLSSHGCTSIPSTWKISTTTRIFRKSKPRTFRVNTIYNRIKAPTVNEQTISVKGIINVKVVAGGVFSNLSLTRPLDDIADLLGKSLILELISEDTEGADEGQTLKAYARKVFQDIDDAKYECDFQIPESFGEVGAVFVDNEHHKEMYIKDITIEGLPNGPVTITCDSWVAPKPKRLFFTNKSCLPSQTPSGLKKLREKELEDLRGDGTGERKNSDRIYDYDVYNDLGDPDNDEEFARPVLGGPEHPYPRRCRTGRCPTKTDPLSEERASDNYVPRDEEFSSVKSLTFSVKTVKSVLKALIPSLETSIIDPELRFPYFTRIDSLYDEGVPIPKDKGIFKSVLPRLIKAIRDGAEELLLFEPPELINRDKFAWFRDEELARQTLAGLNPYSIQLVTEWPMRSKLDPEVYGPAESAITTEIIEEEIKGIMTVEEALKRKKLFVLDYHDLYLPYVEKVRELKRTTLYGSRTLFFLTEGSILRPVAIELTRPKIGDKPQWRHVYTPCYDASSSWLWRLAKAHASAHDAGYHQLVIHWLRTHCCMEPYIIAANRQLSALHPIFRLLHPHFRFTMEINALARQALVNAGGIIESAFSPGKYAVELSSVAYDKLWRFDMEALPADLMRRGMAVEDPAAEHGLKLLIEDYPFANDGLILWDAIKTWVSDYVNHYYPDDNTAERDTELQAWWTEVRTKGHANKKDEPWWPVLNTKENLVHTLSTIIWVASGHHAAVNFGQYMYAGYFPSRPTIARINMPNESPEYGNIEDEEFYRFVTKPESVLLKCFPSQVQATQVMSILDVLSNHSPDEEYIGESLESSWAEDPIINATYERFQGRLKEMEGIIDERNSNPKNKNRFGSGVVPYELLKPVSEPGVTGMGVPNSISI